MATVELRTGDKRAIADNNLEASADAETTTQEGKNVAPPAPERPQGPPSVPWHVLFPPGHPMHGAGHA